MISQFKSRKALKKLRKKRLQKKNKLTFVDIWTNIGTVLRENQWEEYYKTLLVWTEIKPPSEDNCTSTIEKVMNRMMEGWV